MARERYPNKRVLRRDPAGRYRKTTMREVGIGGVCPNCCHLLLISYDGDPGDKFPDPRKYRYRCYTCEPTRGLPWRCENEKEKKMGTLQDINDLPCPHPKGDISEMVEFFGLSPRPCADCAATRHRYQDVYLAVGGNVYAIARLAEAGLIPGLRPTLNDLNRAGRLLFGQLDAAYKAADLEIALKQLVGQLQAPSGGQPDGRPV